MVDTTTVHGSAARTDLSLFLGDVVEAVGRGADCRERLGQLVRQPGQLRAERIVCHLVAVTGYRGPRSGLVHHLLEVVVDGAHGDQQVEHLVEHVRFLATQRVL